MKEKIKNIIIIIQTILIIASLGVLTYSITTTSASSVYYSVRKETVKTSLDNLKALNSKVNNVGNAEAEHILSGKTLYVKGVLVTGEMEDLSSATLVATSAD